MVTFATEVVAESLLRDVVRQASISSQQAEQTKQLAQNAALGEQRNANLNLARTDDRLANQEILAVWRAIPKETRARALRGTVNIVSAAGEGTTVEIRLPLKSPI